MLLLVLVGYAMTTGYFMQGLAFLFTPDFSHFSGTSMLTAMGQAFFSLSLGMGTIMVYGSYLPKDISIAGTSVAVALSDTMVALIAGMAIFPIVFANALIPGAGPSLIFETIPVAFGHMAGGTFFGTLFFVLLLIAAWTSSISLIAPIGSMRFDVRKSIRSKKVSPHLDLRPDVEGKGRAESQEPRGQTGPDGRRAARHVEFFDHHGHRGFDQ